MRILVLDDNAVGAELLTTRLREQGHEAAWEPNGFAALAKLAVTPPPDVIIVDLLMPEMDGERFIAEMAKDERLKWVPVLVVSALGGAELSAFHERRPGIEVLQKPFELDELLAALQRVVPAEMPKPGGSAAVPHNEGG